MPASYYRNETLFSEIYLEEITRQPEQEDVLASLGVLREYREYADTSTLEAWRDSYVHEVLSALGFNTLVESRHITRLFPLGSTETLVSLCFIIQAEERLDNTLMGRNWMEKAIRALREHGLSWGLLTNGKQWRILHQDEPTPYETYLEIDLEAILRNKAKDAYQIFHKFLKSQNFMAHEDGKCLFDRFKKESQDKIDYIEKELANALKQREEGGKGVLSDLCMGYVDELRRRKEGNLDDEDLRKKIYHGAMLYMFRLLFLFYADARRLLSDDNHALLEKVETECRAHRDGKSSDLSSFSIWDSLEQIFVDIDQTYNGGLFSPQESEFTRFLSDIHIRNAYLAYVIYNLTTYHEKNGLEKAISYRDMSVRHLGTLYEGLLEHKLFIAAEDTEVKVAKGIIQFIPASNGGKLVVGHYLKAGEVYFASDPSERKSTGSYYTPEYIVDYIVRNTVGEKLKQLRAGFLQEQHVNLEAYHRAVDDDERLDLAVLLEENTLAFVREQVLELSVLDPAMGSGHFLVNATNLVSNFITEILNDIGIIGELETGTGYWRRWVVENCIYGVDLNPLAVELAKLSLWILSMAKDQPLSFLNHHLKYGNSLVGTWLEEIGNYPYSRIKKEIRQLNLFELDPDFKATVEEIITKNSLIAAKASASLEDVREKKVWLEEIDHLLNGYKALCDVHTNLKINSSSIDEVQYTQIFQKKDFTLARSITTEKYFHWELEFPFLLMKNGFSSVIGNPPYVQLQTMGEMTDRLQSLGFETFVGTGDIFCLFYEQAVRLLRNNGIFGLITSNKWMRAGYGEALRNFFAEKTNPLLLVDFSGQKIFESATVDVNILIVEKARNKNMTKSCAITDLSGINNLSIFIEQNSTLNNYSNKSSWSILSNIEQQIKEKVEAMGVPLQDWNIQINYGIKTGLNEAFIISGEKKNELITNDPKSAEIIRPILRGRDIKRYGYEFPDLWLLYIPWHFPLHKDETITGASYAAELEFKNQFPAVYNHLLSYKDQLLARNKAETGIRYEWYSLQRWGANYSDDFSKQKIIYAETMRVHKNAESDRFPRFGYSVDGIYLDKTCFMITGKNLLYILPILNSSLMNFIIRKNIAVMDTGGYLMQKIYIENLPLPNPKSDIQKRFETIALHIIENRKNNLGTYQLEEEIDSIVYDLFGFTRKEIAFIAGNKRNT